MASALFAMVALVSLLAMAGSAAAQSTQNILVGGTITGATSGTVSIVQGTTTCTLIGGSTGAVSATGTYLMSVNCPNNAASTNVVLNGAVVATFSYVQGTRITANGQVGAAPTTTATTPAATATAPAGGTPAAPRTGMASEDGSSSAWLLVIAGLGALALGVGGVTAVRKSR
jgi:hypothetical protein